MVSDANDIHSPHLLLWLVLDNDIRIRLYCSTCSWIKEGSSDAQIEQCEKCFEPLQYQCVKCSRTFNFLDLCIQHQKHECNGSYKLDANASHDLPKRNENDKSEKLKCSHCSYTTISSLNLGIHVRNSHVRRNSENSHILYCDHCGYNTSCQHSLITHIRYTHTLETCPRCKCSINYHFYARHLRSCEQTSKKYNCSFCCFTSDDRAVHSSHLRKKHPGKIYKMNDIALNCNLCSYLASSYQKLLRHMRENHTYVECTNCRQTMKYRQHQRHQKMCGRAPDFQCAHCDYVTYRKEYLLSHIRTRRQLPNVH